MATATDAVPETHLTAAPRTRGDRLELVAATARTMREAQRRYFQTRSREDLIVAKHAERELDGLLAELRLVEPPPITTGTLT